MNKRKKHPRDGKCDLGLAMDVIGGLWKGEILWFLQGETRRFTELRRLIPRVSGKVLTQKLRALEHDGLIEREHHREIPPRVEYSMAPLGRTVIPVLEVIALWWKEHGAQVLASNEIE